MNFFLLLTVVALTNESLLDEITIMEKWAQFKKLHRKKIISIKEEIYRRRLFLNNLHHLKNHNERYRQGLETYEMGLNQFSDKTEEETLLYTNGLPSEIILKDLVVPRKFLNYRTLQDAPESLDWRNKGIVTPVKSQGPCGSCWAFSAIGSLEARYQLVHGIKSPPISLSEQQLVDCVSRAHGCRGGWMSYAFDYIKNVGSSSSHDYPYKRKEGPCRYNSSILSVQIANFGSMAMSENQLKILVANEGPISVAFDATGNFKYYKSGIYFNSLCSTKKFTHAVVIVGYGTENGMDYWLIKNSYGPLWGDNGYAKIARNKKNHCGIASKVTWPVVL